MVRPAAPLCVMLATSFLLSGCMGGDGATTSSNATTASSTVPLTTAPTSTASVATTTSMVTTAPAGPSPYAGVWSLVLVTTRASSNPDCNEHQGERSGKGPVRIDSTGNYVLLGGPQGTSSSIHISTSGAIDIYAHANGPTGGCQASGHGQCQSIDQCHFSRSTGDGTADVIMDRLAGVDSPSPYAGTWDLSTMATQGSSISGCNEGSHPVGQDHYEGRITLDANGTFYTPGDPNGSAAMIQVTFVGGIEMMARRNNGTCTTRGEGTCESLDLCELSTTTDGGGAGTVRLQRVP